MPFKVELYILEAEFDWLKFLDFPFWFKKGLLFLMICLFENFWIVFSILSLM